MNGAPANELPVAGESVGAPGPAGVPIAGATETPPPAIPDHTLIRRIGSGSYGDVWLARTVLGVLRAVKVIYRSRFIDARPFEREFEGIQRFEPISRSHPSQLAILHVGKNDAAGCFYYVMELADDSNAECGTRNAESGSGVSASIPQSAFRNPHLYSPHTLRHDLEQHTRLPVPDCVQIGVSLTTALAHLHQHGLVHRDIKPSNVIFVNGVPKLGDIGLVTETGDTQSIVGTEGYLPPEGPGTPPADIFSLGKVLYEISTGLDRRQFAELPEDLRDWPDRNAVVEFNEIVLKACAKDPARRYQSADAMRADLELLQRGQSVKRRRAWQRNLSLATKLILLTSGLVAVAAVTYWLTIEWPKSPNFVRSEDPNANEEYDQGVRLLHTGGGFEQGIRHLETAIEKDPGFAEAYAQLAGAWLGSGPTGPKDVGARARSAALKAVALNTNSSFGHAALASVKVVFDLDWAGAEEERRLALKLNSRGVNPNTEQILLESALNLAVMGKTNEALAALKQARAGPESTSIHRLLFSGFVYEWCHQFDEAIKTYDQVIELDERDSAWEQELQARAYLGKGDYTNAIRLGRLAALGGSEDRALVNARFDALENALKAGTNRFWEVQLQLEEPKSDRDHLMRMAAIHARLNRPTEAFDFLKRARNENPTSFASGIETDPSFDSLRKDKRFQDMIAELWRKK